MKDSGARHQNLTCQKLKDGGADGRSWTKKTKFVELGISKKTGEPYGSLVLEHTEQPKVRNGEA